MQTALILLGVIIGCSAGVLLTWFFAKNGPPPEPFFLRFLRVENRSARLDTRLMVYELNSKVNELAETVGRMDRELQEMRDLVAGARGGLPAACSDGEETAEPERLFSGACSHEEEQPITPGRETLENRQRNREVAQMLRRGSSPGEVTEKLQVARGEVELLQSLVKKSSLLEDQ